MCDNGPVTRRAEQDSAIGVRDVGEDRAGSAPGSVPSGTEQAGPSGAVQGNAIRISGMGLRRAVPSGSVLWGQRHGDSAQHCHHASCRGDGAGSALPCAAQQDPPPGVTSPVPTLRHPTRGIVPVTSACERGGGGAGGAAFPSAGAEGGRLRLD